MDVYKAALEVAHKEMEDVQTELKAAEEEKALIELEIKRLERVMGALENQLRVSAAHTKG